MESSHNHSAYYGDRREIRCDVVLQNHELWKQFHDLNTEMIITKSGRRMFPALRIQVRGLDPLARYCILLEFIPQSDSRYKYGGINNGWSRGGQAEPQSPHRVYLHPDSPANGAHWMAQTINFNRVKLTNSSIPQHGHVVLNSMHKYQPRIIIVQAPDSRALPWAPATFVSFPETQFIAVTAYQNEKITKLKIDNNPFAKGFRENGQSRTKRKREDQEEKNSNNEKSKKSCISSDESVTSSPESTTVSDSHIPSPICYQPPSDLSTWYSYPLYKYSYEQINPYYMPQSSWTPSYSYSSYLPPSFSHKPQNLSVSNQKQKCLTDFSIRAIIES